MRKISLALAFIASILALPAQAANFTAKDASAATIIFTNPGNCTTGCTPIFSWSDSTGTNLVAVLTAGADAASNTATGGLVYGRNLVFNGTTWDRWTGAVTNAGTFAVQLTGATNNINNIAGTISLPTGAATAAKQPALGTAGTPSADVITVQGAASMTPIASNITQVLGAANSATNGLFVRAGSGQFASGSYAAGALAAGAFAAGAGVDGWDLTQGTKADTACAAPTSSTACSVIAGLKGIIDVANTPGQLKVNTTGGATPTGNIAANNTTAVVVKASAGTLYGVQLAGLGSAPAYLKIYNATSATCGSGTPVKRLMIPAASTAANGAGSNITFGPMGVAFGTGITYCITTGITDADTTAPAASTFLVNLDWN